MPRYDFKCSECGEVIEMTIPVADYKEMQECPKCKKETAKRIWSKDVSFRWKGQGFYVNDYGAARSHSEESTKE